MKIKSVQLLGENLPTTLLEVRTDSGLIGIGGTESPAAAIKPILEQRPWRLSEVVLDRDPSDVLAIAADLFSATLGQGGPIANAMGALDMAVWDLCGKVQGRPLHQLFGGAVQDRVMVYASATAFDLTHGLITPLPFKTTARLVEEARNRVREGFKAIKFGWGNHFTPSDQERIAAIRDAIGPEIHFMLDLGGPDYFSPGLTPKSLLPATRMLEKYGVFFLEEPFAPFDVESHLQLTRDANVRVATGEMLCHGYEFDRFIQAGAVDVIQPDAYRIGVTQTLRVARRAAERGILCVPHSPWSILAIAAHLQVLSTVPTGIMLEYPSPSLFTDTARHGAATRINTSTIVTHPLRVKDGFLELPAEPGLGVGQFNTAAIEEVQKLSAEGFER